MTCDVRHKSYNHVALLQKSHTVHHSLRPVRSSPCFARTLAPEKRGMSCSSENRNGAPIPGLRLRPGSAYQVALTSGCSRYGAPYYCTTESPACSPKAIVPTSEQGYQPAATVQRNFERQPASMDEQLEEREQFSAWLDVPGPKAVGNGAVKPPNIPTQQLSSSLTGSQPRGEPPAVPAASDKPVSHVVTPPGPTGAPNDARRRLAFTPTETGSTTGSGLRSDPRSGSACVSHSLATPAPGDKDLESLRADRARERKRHNDNVTAREKKDAAKRLKKKDKSKSESARHEENLIAEAKTLFSAEDGKKIVSGNARVHRMLAERTICVIAARAKGIDKTLTSSDPSRKLYKFPGLALLVASLPRKKGFNPSQAPNPDPTVFAEGLRQLGTGFFAPICRDVMLTAVRHYKLYTKLASLEDRTDSASVTAHADIQRYLDDECPKFVLWKLHHGDAIADREVRRRALQDCPLNRFLHFLEKTRARTTAVDMQIRECGKTLNSEVVRACHDYLVQSESGRNKSVPGMPRPDPVVFAAVKSLHFALLSALKGLTDQGRVRALCHFTKKLGAVYFKMGSSAPGSYDVSIPEPFDNGMINVSGIAALPDAKVVDHSDRFGSPNPLPLDMDDLERVMEPKEIEFNTTAVKDLAKDNTEMTLEVKLTRYVTKKGRKFDTTSCSHLISSLEAASEQVARDQSVEEKRRSRLHTLSLRMLCDFLSIEEPAVLLACHENSIRAVHAVALTLLGTLRDHEGGGKPHLTPLLKAHKGPMTLFYNTNEGPKWIGLMGVKRLPGKRPTQDLASPLGTQSNQFDYDMSSLNDKYQEHVKNITFISREDAAKRGYEGNLVPGDDDDEGDDGAGVGVGTYRAHTTVHDDGMEAQLGDMEGDFD